MTKVSLEYNPFSGKTVCKINGEDAVLQKCWGDPSKGSRLQDWIGKFLPALDSQENDDSYEIEFFGLPSDCKDFQTACNEFQKTSPTKQITLQIKEGKSSENRIEDLRALFYEMQETSPYEDLKTDEIRKNFEDALSNVENIGVVATMSSGKSTLINALLGQELLPARNEATTAIVAKIHNKDSQKVFSVKAYTHDGKIIEDSDEASLKILEKLNSNPELSYIELTGDIPNIHELGMDIVLNDTPGPNNSATDEHKRHTYDLLNSDFKPMILYVFNAKELQAHDDKTLLIDVANKINMPGTQSKDRFLFVLNKADALEVQKNESIEKAIQALKEYLAKRNIYDPQIFPVSAQLAKVIRMHKNNLPLSEDEEEFLGNKVKRTIKNEKRQFSRFAPLSFSGKQKQEALIQAAKDANDNEALADVYSGVPAVEIAINEYIEKYAISAKVKKAVESFGHVLDRFGLQSTSTKTLNDSKAAREEAIVALQKIEEHLKQGKEGQEYIKRIDELSITTTLENSLKTIEKELHGYLGEYDGEPEIPPEEARYLIEKLKQKLKKHSPKLESDIDKVLQDSVIHAAQKIVASYKEHVSKLVAVGEFDVKGVSLSAMITTSINADSLIRDFIETKDEQIGTKKVLNEDKKWYKPWTWFESKYTMEPVMGKKDYVNYKDLYEKVIGDITEQFDKNIDSIEHAAICRVSELKTFFKDELVKLDSIIAKKIKEQKSLLGDEKRFAEAVAKEEARLQWIKDFNAKLNAVLAINF